MHIDTQESNYRYHSDSEAGVILRAAVFRVRVFGPVDTSLVRSTEGDMRGTLTPPCGGLLSSCCCFLLHTLL